MLDKVSKLPLIGPAFVSRLEKLEIKTIRDLLYHLPVRYDDFSKFKKIKEIEPGEVVTVQATVKEIKNIFTRGGFVLQKGIFFDDTGEIKATWFNQRFLVNSFHKGDKINLCGQVQKDGFKAPEFELVKDFCLHTGRLVPIYAETAGISSKWLRSRIYNALKIIKIDETLDENILKENNFLDLKTALFQIHFPDNLKIAKEAKKRLAFEELLWAQLEAATRKKDWEQNVVGNKFNIYQKELDQFIKNLPFELTSSQKKVIEEIKSDLSSNIPMNRLLQGDVGSGKTVVAALAMYLAKLNGYQAVLMAPTEILANQHLATLKKMGLDVGIATGSNKDNLNSDIVVGTHALLAEKINFKKLGLIVIDEQHRFGVEQRAMLSQKGKNPHILTMTATPIPRTVALTLYGDLDMSVLTDMPKNRLPVKTWVVPETKREAAYKWITAQKTQTFIICPFIEESETMQSVKAATTEFERLKKIFIKERLGLIHGKIKNKEKILEDFRKNKIDILVATPVIEVGIDIPQASIIMVEAADRFGLAQLHQLRGRVGRGDLQSYCLLFSQNGDNWSRLKYLEKLNNGLKLAEVDFKFRGPGQRFGTQQHGRWGLSIASFDDLELIEKTNQFAKTVLKNPSDFPLLMKGLQKSKINIASN